MMQVEACTYIYRLVCQYGDESQVDQATKNYNECYNFTTHDVDVYSIE